MADHEYTVFTWFCYVVCQITGAQVQDSGRYTCEATNIAGKTEKNYNLNVWGMLFYSLCLFRTWYIVSSMFAQ